MKGQAQRVEAARQNWNAGNLAGYLSLYDPSIKLYGYSTEPMDKAAVTAFYEMIWSSLGKGSAKNPHLEFHEVLTEGNLYTCRFTMSGTHRGSFLGAPATNRTYILPGITIMRFSADGQRVVERFSSADMLGLLVQVGALPPPV